jgi:hypothetical protein
MTPRSNFGIERIMAGELSARAVHSQNLKPDVLMMEPAEVWHRCDVPNLLLSSRIRAGRDSVETC